MRVARSVNIVIYIYFQLLREKNANKLRTIFFTHLFTSGLLCLSVFTDVVLPCMVNEER